jgi:NADH-quinone oxidoreductase subunit N
MITAPDALTLTPLAPLLSLLIAGSVALLVGVGIRDVRPAGAIALVGLVVAAVFAGANLAGAQAGPTGAFGLQWRVDAPSAALSIAILIGAFLAILIGWDALAPAGMDQPEYYALLLFATGGGLTMVHAGDFIVLLLGLEILSLSVYALSAWRMGDHQSEEAGMKYFLLGAFASAVLVYGIALVYGATGAFSYAAVAAALADGPSLLALLGGTLVLAGLGFKVSLAPFHQWAPDVYTGAPTPVTAFMSVAVKAAAFGALVRVFAAAWPDALPTLDAMLAVLVALTLLVGNFGALLQSGAKRMLAYSAVAHAGYLGLAVLAAGQDAIGPQAIAWYLLAYTFMNAGAFAVLLLVMNDDPRGDAIEAWNGLARRRPGLAIAMTLFLFSLAGIPPLAGFFGKFLAVQAGFEAGYAGVAVLALITAVVAVVYYLRLVWAMWLASPARGEIGRSAAADWAIGLAAAGTVALGLFPSLWYGLVEGARTVIAAGL